MKFYLVRNVDVNVGLQQALYTVQVTPVRRPQKGIQSVLKKHTHKHSLQSTEINIIDF